MSDRGPQYSSREFQLVGNLDRKVLHHRQRNGCGIHHRLDPHPRPHLCHQPVMSHQRIALSVPHNTLSLIQPSSSHQGKSLETLRPSRVGGRHG